MRLGLIGTGIARSLAPALHEEEGRHHGLRIDYRLIELGPEDDLAEPLRSVRNGEFAGVNVTYPFKQSILPLLDDLSAEAHAIGAVNTVVRDGKRLVGHNTDGSGWRWGFSRALPGGNLARVVLLGAGGAGAACGHAAIALGARRVLVVDRDKARATTLASRLNEHAAGAHASASDLAPALDGATGLIHATPTGMDGQPGLPLAPEMLRPDMWVSEVVYRPLETELVKTARRLGCTVVDGGHMNVGQALHAFRLFTGLEPDPSRMEAHFRTLVASTSSAAYRS